MSEAERRGGPEKRRGVLGWLRMLGPGLTTGVADVDPTAIASCVQYGAQFRFALLWVPVLTLPLLIGIQRISAQIGRVTGRGIAENLRAIFPKGLVATLVAALCAANAVTLGADLAVMGESMRMIAGAGPPALYSAGFAILSLALQATLDYRAYARVLAALCFSVLAYVASGLLLGAPWGEALGATFAPAFRSSTDYVRGVAAMLGSALTPYLYFWQSGQEVEEEKVEPKGRPLARAPRQAKGAFRRITADTVTGMAVMTAVSWFAILTAAMTLHARGTTDVERATQAAEALRPAAGPGASLLFAAGMIGTGMLSLPILAGASAFALGGTFGWKTGYRLGVREAPHFYAAIAATTLVGLSLNAFRISPLRALVHAAVLNNAVAAPVCVLVVLLAGRKEVMKGFAVRGGWLALGWAAAAALGLSTIVFAASTVFGN